MKVDSCTSTEIRVPFQVDDDTSRTWILTLKDGKLLLKHDHRHKDGTPDKITNYGGYAARRGSANHQHFPADEFTANLLPAARGNVWTMEFRERENQFVYALERDGELRYRGIFDVSRPQTP